MRRLLLALTSGCILLACGRELRVALPPLPAVVKASFEQVNRGEAALAMYMVAFRTQTSANALHFASYSQEYRTHYSLLANAPLLDPGVKDIHFIAGVDLSDPGSVFADPSINPPAALQLAWQEKSQNIRAASLARVEFRDHAEAGEILDRWYKEGKIWFAEPNYLSYLDESKPMRANTTANDFLDDDDDYSNAWHEDIDLRGALQILEGEDIDVTENRPVIAIMDSGIDVNHSYIQDNMFENADAGETNCGSGDTYGCNTTDHSAKGAFGNGDIAPFLSGGHGEDCPTEDGKAVTNCAHGTHVAGIAAGVNMGDGSGGVCPVCSIMALRVVGDNPNGAIGQKRGSIQDSSIAKALKYASQFRRGANLRVINASFGKFQRSRSVAVLVHAITDTPNNRGIIVVGAAGNEDSMRMQYPAAYSDAIAVANVHGKDEAKAVSSNFGRWVDVSAPGMGINSAIPGGSFEPKNGTSMAAPFVSGIIGLIALQNPGISVQGIRDRIIKGADPTIYNESVNQSYLTVIDGVSSPVPLLGSGIVNATNAVNGTIVPGRPAVLSLDRIEPGCGVLGLGSAKGLAFLLLIPLLLAIGLGINWNTRATSANSGRTHQN